MASVCLIHWHPAEAAERGERLRAGGWEVRVVASLDGEGREALRTPLPDALVIDLSRLPSHGRETALAWRSDRRTRGVPLVFVGGDPVKVERLRAALPDAVYAGWDGIDAAIASALAAPPASPVVPPQPAGYSGTPLPQKLGIKPASVVLLLGAPEGFEETLGTLPPGAELRRDAETPGDVVIWFVRNRAALAELPQVAPRAGAGGLWIAWPKLASGVATDLKENDVRAAGLAAGLVDIKVAALDPTWAGLRFARRR